MNKENTEHLLKNYPILYQDAYKSPRETCMCWGFECGDGWFHLIDDLSKKIEEWNNKNPDKLITAAQVKEKFGTLCFYTNGYYDEISKLIDEAEEKSIITCEECGSTDGVTQTSPPEWITTLCKKCMRKHKLKMKIRML